MEKVQRRASHIGLDIVLKWPTLKQRRLFSSLTECYKTLNRPNGLDATAFFMFARDFRPSRANHRFKLKFASATLNSFKHSFFIRVIDKWNYLPKEIAEAKNLNIFENGLTCHLANFSSEH